MYQEVTLLEMCDFAFLGSLRLLLLFVSQDASLLEPYDFAILDSFGLLLQFAHWVLDSAPCLSEDFHEGELSVVDVLPPVEVPGVQAEAA